MVFLHPEFDIGKEEVLGFILAIVEAAGAPGRVAALWPVIKIQVLAAVKARKSLSHVVHAMAVDYVHNHRNALPVGVIDKALELLRRPETGAQGEEIRNLIPE